MFRVDTAVDDGNNHPFTIEADRSAQTRLAIEQFEEVEAEIGCQRADFVFPDVQDLRKAVELVRFRRIHLGGEAVEAVLVAINQLGAGTRPLQDFVLLFGETRRVVLNRGAGLVEMRARNTRYAGFCEGLLHLGMVFPGRRHCQLHDVNFALLRVFAISKLNAAQATRIA